MKKVLVILFALMCSFAYTQQLSLHTSNKFGIGLNADKTFSPELRFSAERHPFLTDYYMLYTTLGCKMRYYKCEYGNMYSGAYVSTVFAYNTENDDGEGLMYNAVPDFHIFGVEVYPFNKDFLGVSMYLRMLNYESLRGYGALLVRF